MKIPIRPSELKMWEECPTKWFFRYNLGIEPIEKPSAAIVAGNYGHIRHRATSLAPAVKMFEKENGFRPPKSMVVQIEALIASGVIDVEQTLTKKDTYFEAEVERFGWPFSGMLDQITIGESKTTCTIQDYKFTTKQGISRYTEEDLALSIQAAVYLFTTNADAITFHIYGRSTSLPRKDEDEGTWYKRLIDEASKDWDGHYKQIRITPEDLFFSRDILQQKAIQIETARKIGFAHFYKLADGVCKHLSSCSDQWGPCPFREICWENKSYTQAQAIERFNFQKAKSYDSTIRGPKIRILPDRRLKISKPTKRHRKVS